MEIIQQSLFSNLILLLLAPSIFGIATWCKNQFEGFGLEDNYNPNYPPTDNFILNDVHRLMQIEKVQKSDGVF